MSEVKNVTITVPVGLNGWQQEGSVVINGMKVEFPVGVETEVPETAAALLKELIEAAEKRTENVPANNDYKGSLTVPAGHTLRVEKGANFLNYGESVETRAILAETVMHKTEDDGNTIFMLPNQPSEPYEHGKIYGINYNGTVYNCNATDSGIALDGVANGQFWFGNMDSAGLTGISGSNTDAPFFMYATYEGQIDDDIGMTYGMLLPLDGAESVTLSITEKVDVTSGGGGGAGIVFVNVTIGDQKDAPNGDIYAVEFDVISIDKTFDELKEAINRGSLVQLSAKKAEGPASYYLQLVSFETGNISFAAAMLGMHMVCRVMESEFDAENVKTTCDLGIVQ